MRRMVDLPQPDGPTSTTSSPAGTSRVSPPTATVPSGYTLRTPSSRIGAAAVAFTHAPCHRLGRVPAQPDDPRNPWFSWQLHHARTSTLSQPRSSSTSRSPSPPSRSPRRSAIPLAVLAYKVRWLGRADPRPHGRALHHPVAGAVRAAGPDPGADVQPPSSSDWCSTPCSSIVRNALTGLRQVPAEVREAAQGMGYGPAGLLWRIELPLALPGILTGLRIATVSTVALVTVGTLVGFGGFGNVILTGFNSNFYKPQIIDGHASAASRSRWSSTSLLLGARSAGHARGPGESGVSRMNIWQQALHLAQRSAELDQSGRHPRPYRRAPVDLGRRGGAGLPGRLADRDLAGPPRPWRRPSWSPSPTSPGPSRPSRC